MLFSICTVKALLFATVALSSVQAGEVRSILSLDPKILAGGAALINVNVLADVLGPLSCTGNAVVGIQATANVGNLIAVCACVEVFPSLASLRTPCPKCTDPNASPICAGSSGFCGCECNYGYYSTFVNGKQVCVPSIACSIPNTLVQLLTGRSECVCARGYISDLTGGCINACLVV